MPRHKPHIFEHPIEVSQRRRALAEAALVVLAAILLLISGASASATAATPSTTSPSTICPSYGADSECGTIITVTNSGATVTSTGQGPYDGADDTLVGIVNETNQPLSTLSLESANEIFAFDGDGIDTYGAPSNPRDLTGYGGPDTYFGDMSPDMLQGEVDFVTPLPAHGGTTYFSLESALSSAYSCQEAISEGLEGPVVDPNDPASISAQFEPKLGLALSQAASLCGFANFNWQQWITAQPYPSPFAPIGQNAPRLSAPPAYLDPQPGGYRAFSSLFPGGFEDQSFDAYPFYYDSSELMKFGSDTDVLEFEDEPINSCLPLGNGDGCGGVIAHAGSVDSFTTQLVGETAAGTPVPLGIGFTWYSTATGDKGGVTIVSPHLAARAFSESSPLVGEGGVAVVDIQKTSSYQYDGIRVTGVNGTEISTPSLTTTALTASSSTLASQEVETLTATVDGVASSVATGSVAFSVIDAAGSTTPIANCSDVQLSPTSTGTAEAVCETASLPVGTDVVRASYAGDSMNQPSESESVAITVTAQPTSIGPSQNVLAYSKSQPTPSVPILSGLQLTPRAVTAAYVKAHRHSFIRFSLSSPATVLLTVLRLEVGHRVGSRCIANSGHEHRAGGKCTRDVNIGTIARRAFRTGRNMLLFTDRVGGRTLSTGKYELRAQVIGAAGFVGKPQDAVFTVTR